MALYRTRPDLAAGEKLTFLGEYDPRAKRIRLLDPPWIHVTWPRRLHWRIYFSVSTGKNSSRAISRYLEPAQAVALVKKPVIKKYIEKVKADRRARAPKLSLHDVYGGKVPKQFAKLDARATMVGVYCDNLGRTEPDIQQCFFVTPDKAVAGGIAMFTGTVQPNRPELNYHQKEDKDIHHFNVTLQNAEPIQVRLKEETARQRFVAEVLKAKPAIEKMLKREKLTFLFDPASESRITWMERWMVVSGVITTRPQFSMRPVPYASASVFFNPTTGRPERLTVFRRIHQDPRD